jgi:hypothetical protein
MLQFGVAYYYVNRIVYHYTGRCFYSGQVVGQVRVANVIIGGFFCEPISFTVNLTPIGSS